jgi:C4-dicarboxylate-specific signal transduction histidine kinase
VIRFFPVFGACILFFVLLVDIPAWGMSTPKIIIGGYHDNPPYYNVLTLALVAALLIASFLRTRSLRKQVRLRTAELLENEHELRKAHADLEQRVAERTADLVSLNRTLDKRLREEVAKNRQKDLMLIRQNRQAALGEMLDHIAHQWKQPLNSIYLIIQNLGESWSCNELANDSIEETVDKTMALVEHMSQTINVFRDFYQPEKEKIIFSIKDSIDRALSFIAPTLKIHSIVGIRLSKRVRAGAAQHSGQCQGYFQNEKN